MIQVFVNTPAPNPVQAKYYKACANPAFNAVIFKGGAGSGKTVGQCTQIIDLATKLPSNLIAVVRKYKVDLKDTIQKDFFDHCHPQLIIHHSKEDQITKIRTYDPDHPCEIHWRGLDDTARWGSRHFGQIFLEEASETDVKDYNYLLTRLRHNLHHDVQVHPDNPYILYAPEEPLGYSIRRFISLCYNPPEDPNHWLYEFHREGTVQGKEQKVCVIHSETMDNEENLDSTYKEILKNLPLHEYHRMVKGGDSTGVQGYPVAYMFKEEVNTFHHTNPESIQNYFCGQDLGWAVPNKLWGYEVDGTLYITDELVRRKQDLRHFTKKECPLIEQEHHPDAKYTDFVDHQHALQHNDKNRTTSEEILRNECGRNPRHSYSRPDWRGQLVNELLRTQRLWISKKCRVLINALAYGWSRDNDGEIISDGYWEHIGDSLGYLCWGVFKGRLTTSVREKRQGRATTRSRHIKEELEPHRQGRAVNTYNYGGRNGRR